MVSRASCCAGAIQGFPPLKESRLDYYGILVCQYDTRYVHDTMKYNILLRLRLIKETVFPFYHRISDDSAPGGR